MVLIDADALIKRLKQWDTNDPKDKALYNFAMNRIFEQPTVDAVPLSKIYRLIEGHSNYHGDSILAALTCVAEGKNVELIKPVDAVPVVHAKWIAQNDALTRFMCSHCKSENHEGFETYCPKCGAKMDAR